MRKITIILIVCVMFFAGCAKKQPKTDTPANNSFVTTKVWIETQGEDANASKRSFQSDDWVKMFDTSGGIKSFSLGLGALIGIVTPILESAIDHGYDALVKYVESEKAKYSAGYSGIGSALICYNKGKVVNKETTLHIKHGKFPSENAWFEMSFDVDFNATSQLRISPKELIFNESSARKKRDDKDFAVTIEFLTYSIDEKGVVKAKPFFSHEYKFFDIVLKTKLDTNALSNMKSPYMSLPITDEKKTETGCFPVAAKVSVIETEDVPVLLEILAKSTADAKTETTKQLKSVLKEILDELKDDKDQN